MEETEGKSDMKENKGKATKKGKKARDKKVELFGTDSSMDTDSSLITPSKVKLVSYRQFRCCCKLNLRVKDNLGVIHSNQINFTAAV